MIGEEIQVGTPIHHCKWIRLITDTPTVFLEVAKGRMKISDYLASMKGRKEFAVFDPGDPIPFFVELLMIPYLWAKRGF